LNVKNDDRPHSVIFLAWKALGLSEILSGPTACSTALQVFSETTPSLYFAKGRYGDGRLETNLTFRIVFLSDGPAALDDLLAARFRSAQLWLPYLALSVVAS
jgi:hypothetical protein